MRELDVGVIDQKRKALYQVDIPFVCAITWKGENRARSLGQQLSSSY
jgi:hypothetical protein